MLLRGAFTGSRVTIHERFEPGALLAGAPDGAHVALVPTMLERLVRGGGDLRRLGVLLVGGGALDPDAARPLPSRSGAASISTYGSTETGGGIVYDGRVFEGSDGPDRLRAARRPRRDRAPRPDDHGRLPCGPGRDRGRLHLRRVAAHRRLGRLDAAGRLAVRGRADDAIRTGAETVWPDEVEAVLRTHSGVGDVAVAGRPDAEWGAHVTAWVVPAKPQDPPTLEELREHCRDDLARFKAPRDLRIVTTLPRTASGKVRRAALP